jgi:hypothetical protein
MVWCVKEKIEEGMFDEGLQMLRLHRRPFHLCRQCIAARSYQG